MKYLLPVLVLAAVLYTAPLYPVYAQSSASSSTTTRRPAFLQNKPGGGAATNSAEKRPTFGNTVASRASSLRMELSEEIASRTAAFRAKLQLFKDQNKAKRVEDVNSRLAEINKNRTDQMLKVLTMLEEFVSKIQSKIDSAQGENIDKNPVKTALGNAKSKIETAKTAVEAQAKKEYMISVDSEETVATDARVTRDNLHKDLKAVHDLVVEARKAVVDALTSALTTLKGGSSGSQSN